MTPELKGRVSGGEDRPETGQDYFIPVLLFRVFPGCEQLAINEVR
jgi:hypothetical protein